MLKIWKRRGSWVSLSDGRRHLVPIVSNAAIATDAVGDGRILPLVILDTTHRPDLVDFFAAHETLPPGDVDSTWVTLDGFPGHIALWLEFKKPFEAQAILDFELIDHGLAVDLAMHGRVMYLQAGRPGDRMYLTMSAPRIIVEIGAEMSMGQWEEIWLNAIKRRLRDEGESRSNARRLAPELMHAMRDTAKRLGSMPSGTYIFPDIEADE